VTFGAVPVGAAAGAILAHSVRLYGGTIRKGTVLGAPELQRLSAAGIAEVVVARLSPDDVHEDEAAERIAMAIAGAGILVQAPFTGRANLHADAAGLLVADRDLIDRLNRIDPAITIATVAAFEPVEAGSMVATVKIIPFAAPRAAVERAVAEASRATALRVAGFRSLKVGLVATTLPATKASVMDKTRYLLDERLALAGAGVMREDRVAHDRGAVAAALAAQARDGADLLVVFGASAVIDERDVVPAAIMAAGGHVVHFGMPVDPGNLLVLGEISGRPVIGSPGCARSPKENGFDWILNRLLAGLDVTSEAITGLGVGGLLKEIASRPQPREGGTPSQEPRAPARVAALVLAAGQSRRMGGPNKLAATIGGRPLVRMAVEAALASRAASVTVVTGHEHGDVAATLAGLDVAQAHNPDYAEGLSTSLRVGIGSLPEGIDGVVVLLADMPGVTGEVVDRLIDAFDPDRGALIVVPTFAGKRGNPVLWSARFFPELMAVEGDTGGRHLIGANADAVVEVELGAAVAHDVDTPEALAAAGGRLPNP
jgi:molybdenum cofactor cytidylyltransferase